MYRVVADLSPFANPGWNDKPIIYGPYRFWIQAWLKAYIHVLKFSCGRAIIQKKE